MEKTFLLRFLSPESMLVLCMGTLLTGGCVTPPLSSSDDNELADQAQMEGHGVTKAGETLPLPQSPAAEAAAQQEQLQATLAAMVTRLSASDAQVLAEDLAFVRSLPAESGFGSVEEAAKALASMHLAIQGHAIQASPFASVERDAAGLARQTEPGGLPEPQAEVGSGASSLEDWANSLGVHLAGAMARNQYLKSYAVQVLAIQALKKSTPSSAPFASEMAAAVRQNAQAWSELDAQLAPEAGPPPADAGQAELIPGDEAVAPALPFGGGEFASDEDVVKQGQALLEEGKYQEAITTMRRLAPSSLFHAAAAEKIKEVSNLAVQDLRRKAAKAFQSSTPVADGRARLDYLEEAKRYLETALSLYPEADQIETVRQNLGVIERNLETIHSQTAVN